MIKKRLFNKIFITTIIGFIVFVISTFFIKNDNLIDDNFIDNTKVYTMNSDNYISSFTMYVDESLPIIDKVYEIISVLIKNNNKNYLLPSYYEPILPSGTKLNNVSFDGNILSIYFSKEFINASDDQINNIIEALTYTFTDFDEVFGIQIYVDNNLIKYIFNNDFPVIFTDDFGMNKIYDLNSNLNINKIFLNFYDLNNNNTIITKYLNDSREKVEIIVEELTNYFNNYNVISYLDNNIILNNYTITSDSIELCFSSDINDDKLLIDQISNSIFLNYDIDKIRFIYKDNLLEVASNK